MPNESKEQPTGIKIEGGHVNVSGNKISGYPVGIDSSKGQHQIWDNEISLYNDVSLQPQVVPAPQPAKGWFEKPLGIITIGITVTVVGGLILWFLVG